MFERIKFLASALLGLLIGILVTLPLFWLGVRKNVGALRHRAEVSFVQVERRQQTMADESLRLEKKLADLGWSKRKAGFVKVELLRSRLAGYAEIEDKVEISQDLEAALLEVEKSWEQACKQSSKIAKHPSVVEFGLTWSQLKRYLVDEELDFVDEVHAYNHVLRSWPVPTVVGYRSFGGLARAMLLDLRENKSWMLSQSLAWTRWSLSWAVSKVRGRALPERPAMRQPKKLDLDPLYTTLPEPLYAAKAPRPEEDYSEIQYNRSYLDMADVETGEDKAVLENKYVQPYAAPVPTIQKTVTYK
jgi:hypothetical protein